MTIPKVSVIIPTYNRPSLVVRSIKSVLSQTYEDFEILVMDDSRNEETKNAVAEINDDRVRYIHNVERLGFVNNKNQGVRLSNPSSEYIAFLDDDDEYLPLFLERTVTHLQKDLEIFAVTTAAELRTQKGEFVRIYPHENIVWQTPIGNSWVLRRDVFFKDNIWFDASVVFEDLDFGFAVSRRHRLAYLPDVLRIYYGYPAPGEQSMTQNRNIPADKIEAFWGKNKVAYMAIGPKASAWVQMLTGKWLLKTGHTARGRKYLFNSFKTHPTSSAIFFLIAAFIAPSLFHNINAMIIKNKLLKLISS